MSRIRDLLMDRIHNPKPIAHWDFSRYKDSDMTASVNYVEDLTGNGYDLRLNGFDFSTESGFEGYAQDFNKVKGGELISKSRNIVKLIRGSDGYNVSIDKDSYNNTTYIVKVTLPEGVSELWCSCYIGDSYADYGLSADRENQTLVNGINIIQPFSEEYFNNCTLIAFFPLDNTDEPCIIEQFPLNPFSLVFNNCAAVTKKVVALPVQKGFTFIANRKYLDKTVRTILWGKYLTGGDSGYIIGDYSYNSLENYENNIFVYGNSNSVSLDFSEIEDGILWFSDKLYNGEIILSKGTYDDPGTSPLCIGDYTKQLPDNAGKGYGHYAISEAWVFNKTLTKEQVERFIAENATPLPQVYYDVEKQGTLDSDTNKDKIIDFSGNNNHGTLNNFTYDSYYTDEVNNLRLEANNKGDSTLENGVLTILNNNPGYVAASSTIAEGTSVTIPSFKIKVTGVTNDKYINIVWQNADGVNIVSTIKSDGEYTINRYTVTVNGNTVALIINVIGGSFTEPCTIEFLENSNGWGDYDDITDTFVVFNAGVYTKPVFTLDKTNPEYGIPHTLLRSSQQTVSADNTIVRSPEIKMLVHRIEGGRITAGYIKNNVREEGEFILINTPGIYTVPSYLVTVNTTDNYYGFCVTDSGCTELEVEFLPSNVEPSYITDTLSVSTNQAGDSGQISGHSVTYTAYIDKEQYWVGTIRIKESGLKGTIKFKSYGGLGEVILTKPLEQDPIKIGNFADNDIVEINITQDLIDKGYNFIFFKTASSVTAGDKFTVELLPDLNSYIQFDAGKYTHISLDTLTEGFKTVFILCQNDDRQVNCIYDQRLIDATPPENSAFALTTSIGDIAYSYRNGGLTYINGILNETIASNVLTDKRLITVVNNDVSDTLSRNGVIGRDITNEDVSSSLKLYKFLGFKEALSPEQIQKVIERYSLMEGVDPVEDPLKGIHYVADWDAKGRSNDEEGGGISKWIDKVNGKVINLNNFAYAGMSGWNGYQFDWSAWQSDIVNKGGSVTRTKTSIRMTNTGTQPSWTIAYVFGFDSINSFRIRVSGLKPGAKLTFNGKTTLMTITEDGIYTIPSDASAPNVYSFIALGYSENENTDLLIEQLPYYPGALVSDGIDDYGVTAEVINEQVGTVVVLAKYLDEDVNNKIMLNCDLNDNPSRIVIWNYSSNLSIGRPNKILGKTATMFDLTRTPASPEARLVLFNSMASGANQCKCAIQRIIFIEEQLSEFQVNYLKEKVIREYKDWCIANDYDPSSVTDTESY